MIRYMRIVVLLLFLAVDADGTDRQITRDDVARRANTAFVERLEYAGAIDSYSSSSDTKWFKTAVNVACRAVGLEICTDRSAEALLWLSYIDSWKEKAQHGGMFHVSFRLPRRFHVSNRTNDQRLVKFFETYVDRRLYRISLVSQLVETEKPTAIVSICEARKGSLSFMSLELNKPLYYELVQTDTGPVWREKKRDIRKRSNSLDTQETKGGRPLR